jgi:phage tail-like protein
MARSGNKDPVESFRFDVRIVSVSLAPAQLINAAQNKLSQFARIGFTSVTTPEFTNSTIEYRENTDNYVFRKIPGLQRFNEITLSRGVLPDTSTGIKASDKDFYRWANRVNSANPGVSLLNEIGLTQNNNALVRQSENYRKDMIIILRDREGKAARRWYIINAYPSFYKGSSDLEANQQSKAIETMRLEYELAFELPSGVDAAKEFIADIFGGPFADIADDLNLGDF